MSKPASYTGTASVTNMHLSDFEKSFNPLEWPTTAPYLWTDTYLIKPAAGTPSGLPLDRSAPPQRDADLPAWPDRLLFEGAIFGGILYRNVLETSLVNSATEISLEYEQVECLDALAYRAFDGGIDLDVGQGSAKVNGAQIDITVSKTVHFTQPKPVSHDVNLLAHVMVPLSFDFWLHCGLFIQEI
ncbi:MAG TPA: hypothetical protein VKZ18_12445 [Polyangia bacterium]|nr:hypothetical protein [Polyangia bacterium]